MTRQKRPGGQKTSRFQRLAGSAGGGGGLKIGLMDYRIRMTPEGSGDTIGQTGIGTGPFILETLHPEGTTVLKANPDYWEGPPGIETFEIISIPDVQARVQALLRPLAKIT